MAKDKPTDKVSRNKNAASSTAKRDVVKRLGQLAKVNTQEETTDDEDEAQPVLPFRFFDLPSELRLRIYEEALCCANTIDLDPMNYRHIAPRLSLFLVNHQMHEEAYRVFYSQAMRLFPTHGRFFHTKKPLIMRLPPRYRNAINTMELRLGPGWSAPPRGQKIVPELGLSDCTNLRILKVFVEIDPSEAVFAGFRGKNATEETYKEFCVALMIGIFEEVPSITVVEIDAFPAVKRDAPLVTALRHLINQYQKVLLWGATRDWSGNGDPALIGLESLIAGMSLSDSTRLIRVEA